MSKVFAHKEPPNYTFFANFVQGVDRRAVPIESPPVASAIRSRVPPTCVNVGEIWSRGRLGRLVIMRLRRRSGKEVKK